MSAFVDDLRTGRFRAGLRVKRVQRASGRPRAALSPVAALAAERQVPGTGTRAASLRFSEGVVFTAVHTVDALAWPGVKWPVAHAAAIARKQQVTAALSSSGSRVIARTLPTTRCG